ncbi:bifunctional DNA-formamidopyrimidine glycosylase/DNA-(apurinic or apyrimidinic site) lyase [Propionibacteriaceae bacterium Y2011]|uniref:bifunctional DNA-formamidopyrimidine glycosylase/DNA-(apurinic or apyrimidinic site) lyase n=1 Tax=Microlunatus sp. Y2014 TaxID=3418488 RepID=UPI003B4FC9CC
MPELPEVEVVRRGLATLVPGRRISGVTVHHPRPVRRHLPGPDDFAARLQGEVFDQPRRRGKYLWLPLADGDAVLAHLGMSGQFRWHTPDAATADLRGEVPVHRHERVTFDLDDGSRLVFCDQRMFGGLSISDGGAELPAEIAHIGVDPFDPAYDLDRAVATMRRRRTQVKRALLDQTVVSGIGNIYADEALWRARLHWGRATDTLSRAKTYELLGHAADVMAEALAVGGTSFDALYVNVNGESGDLNIDVERVEGSRVLERRDWQCRASVLRRQAILWSDLARRALTEQLDGPTCSVAHRRNCGSRIMRGATCA